MVENFRLLKYFSVYSISNHIQIICMCIFTFLKGLDDGCLVVFYQYLPTAPEGDLSLCLACKYLFPYSAGMVKKSTYCRPVPARLIEAACPSGHAASGSNPFSPTQKRGSPLRELPLFWSEWRDSNPRHPAPKAGALPAALHPVIWFFGGRPVKGPQHIYYITPFCLAQGFSLTEVSVIIF